MKVSAIFLLLSFFMSPTSWRDAEEEAIFQAIFTHDDIERALIHLPRFESTPTKVVLLHNEYTANVDLVYLHSARLVVMDLEEMSFHQIPTYYEIEEFERSGNTATVSFGQMRRYQPDREWVSGDYRAQVNLVRRKGEWVATHVKAQN